ncbi:MAG: hypothetical protein R3Y10_02115 [Ferrimonas sp.]
MFRWFQKRADTRVVGGFLRNDGKMLVIDEKGSFEFSSSSMTEWEQTAARLGSCSLKIVLAAELYQLLAVDRPDVAEEELLQALPFAVRELANVPLPRLHVDYFQFAANPAGRDPLQVVATDRVPLQAMVLLAESVGISITMITIEELALLELLPSTPRPQLLLWHLPEQPMKLLVAMNGQLLFTRNIRGFNQLDNLTELELYSGLFDGLNLELQRSIDYLERQLRQPPADSIALLLPKHVQGAFVEQLENSLGLPVHPVIVKEWQGEQLIAHAAAIARGQDENTN